MNTLAHSTHLVHSLETLQSEKLSFEEVCELLFPFDYEDYDTIFGISKMIVEPETYHRLPIFNGNYVALLMLWGIDYMNAIHDHINCDGKIKVLKGSLTEVNYRENTNFIEFDGSETLYESEIFPENHGGIHSIINNSDEISASLHIFKNEQLNLNGVRIFDTENRRVAWLNGNAASCSWHLPKGSYEKIIKV